MSEYRTILGRCSAEIIEKKSRFIATLCHVETEEEALGFIAEIKHENSSARHNVYAYILSDGRVRYSDDGEPAQTAGMPSLDALKHAGLQNVACVVTRYFGGVLLGTGGLVRAYTESVEAAIRIAHVVEVRACVDIKADLPYSFFEQAQRSVERTDARIIGTEFSDCVSIDLRCPEEDADEIMRSLIELTHGQAEVSKSAPFMGTL